jgi:hypothetical protein
MTLLLAILVGLNHLAQQSRQRHCFCFELSFHTGKDFDSQAEASMTTNTSPTTAAGCTVNADEHSVGALTARRATDPGQLQRLIGMDMAFAVTAMFNAVGCLAISLLTAGN